MGREKGWDQPPCRAYGADMGLDITTCVTDEDYDAWRRVRIAVIPYERSQ